MATTKPSTKTSTTTTGDPEAARITSIKDLADRVEALAAQLTGGGGGPGKAPDVSRETSGGGLDGQVERAVKAAREQDAERTAEETRRKEVADRIKALEERAETRPVERSRLTRWMWGNEDS